jgi:flagellum-specific peptidoglycan hydrolase FlgJ
MLQGDFIVLAFNAAEEAAKHGAPINPAIAAAQAALESNYGNSQLAIEGKNLFGIKAGKSWKGETVSFKTKEFDDAKGMYETSAAFRKYKTWAHCFEDYGHIIGRLSWYKDAVAAKNDPVGFLLGLAAKPGKEPGWATDPRYVEKVLIVAKRFNLINANIQVPNGKHV